LIETINEFLETYKLSFEPKNRAFEIFKKG